MLVAFVAAAVIPSNSSNAFPKTKYPMFDKSEEYMEYAQKNDLRDPKGFFSDLKDRRRFRRDNMKKAWQAKVDEVNEHNRTREGYERKAAPKRNGENFRKLLLLVSYKQMRGRWRWPIIVSDETDVGSYR